MNAPASGPINKLLMAAEMQRTRSFQIESLLADVTLPSTSLSL